MTTAEIIKRAYEIASKYVKVRKIYFLECYSPEQKESEHYDLTVFYFKKDGTTSNFTATQYKYENTNLLTSLFRELEKFAEREKVREQGKEPFEIQTDLD